MIFIGKGIYSGISGILIQPCKEVNQKGFKGIFPGVGKSISGCVLKPIAGVFDGISIMSDGIISTIYIFDKNILN